MTLSMKDITLGCVLMMLYFRILPLINLNKIKVVGNHTDLFASCTPGIPFMKLSAETYRGPVVSSPHTII